MLPRERASLTAYVPAGEGMSLPEKVNGFLLLAVLDEEIRGTVTHPEYDQQNVIAA
jgi:hypothetical protein